MTVEFSSTRLELTEEEAFSLLELCMTSATKLDETSEKAMRKLADFCKNNFLHQSNHTRSTNCELSEAG